MTDQFDTPLQEFDGDLYGRHIEIPQNVAEEFLNANVKRLMCHINSAEPLHCGLMPLGGGRWFLNLNKKFCQRHGLMVGEILHVRLEEDTSRYGMEMPEELEEILKQDEDFESWFHKLTPGKRRNLIHIVGSVKSSAIRIRRGLVIAAHLKKHAGKIDFKGMTQELKEANQSARRE